MTFPKLFTWFILIFYLSNRNATQNLPVFLLTVHFNESINKCQVVDYFIKQLTEA